MLTLLAKHAAIDLTVEAKGDLHVDQHHTVEDVGICFGQALRQALGDKAGIRRYGHFTLPMEETLVTTAHRPERPILLVFQVGFPAPKIGDFDSELVEDFWQAVAANALMQPARAAAPRPQQPSHQRSDVQSDGPRAAHGRRARSADARRAEHQGNIDGVTVGVQPLGC